MTPGEGHPNPPVRRRESPTPSILRLSLVVYGLVLLVTAMAVGAWVWMGKSADVPIEPSPRGVGGKVVSSMILISGVKPFYIDANPITNAEFCVVIHCEDAKRAPNLPAVNVTVAQARQYASYKGKRLPTALEWEEAERTAGPAYRRPSDLWELVETPAGPVAEPPAALPEPRNSTRPVPEGSSSPDTAFRCARNP